MNDERHEYGRHWAGIGQRLRLLACEVTEPEHVRVCVGRVMRRDDENRVSVAAESIRK